jgi:hypothetical protein
MALWRKFHDYINPLSLFPLLSEFRFLENMLFMSVLMGWDYVSELRPPAGLLFVPHMIYKYGAMVEWYLTGENWRTLGKCVPAPLCPQVPHGLTRGRTWAYIVRGRLLNTALAMAWCRKHVGFEPPHLRWRRCYGIWKVFRIYIVARM